MKQHRVRSFLRRSKSARSAAFAATTAALRKYVRDKNRVRVKAIGRRVTA